MQVLQLIEVLKKITINAHITRSMLEDGKVIHAHRKNDAVIDQLSLLMTRLAESMSQPKEESPVPVVVDPDGLADIG